MYYYFRSPLWWRYERRRRILPVWLRNHTDRLFRAYELWRVSNGVTRVMGPRFSRSRTLLEIDLNYTCTLKCAGCNRSIDKAPSDERISLEQIQQLINESVRSNYRWSGIRILGGEPTLHPQFREIIDMLREYKKTHLPYMRITVISNGYTEHTREMLKNLPHTVLVENTAKTSNADRDFDVFSVAPVDEPDHKNSDFRNGCWIMQGLGMGLTPRGYYYCVIAGNVDRIFNFGLARDTIPGKDDPMHDEMQKLCALCGHFCVAVNKGHEREMLSPSWRDAYAAWQSQNKVQAQ